MNNVEQDEAKKVLDTLAREIHGLYGQHAAEVGLIAPKWEELPEPAKGISRDISRLVLSKMQEAYTEGVKLGEAEKAVTKVEKAVDNLVKPAVLVPLPKSWTAKEALEFVKGIRPEIEGFANKITANRPSPLGRGMDAAMSKVTEKITLDVLAENPEIMAKLRQIVESELGRFLSDDEKEEA